MMCHLLWLTYTPISFPARTLFFLFTYWYAEELQKRASVTSLAIVSPHQGSDDVCWQCAELPCDETGDRFISGEVVVMHLLLEMSLTCHPLLTVLSSKS